MKMSRLFAVLAALMMSVMWAAPASAQASRTWISGVGDDANPCSRTAPCKTWAGAISKTAAGGEIDCLDPGGFGAVTITKSITLDCGGGIGGQVGSVLASGTNGIVISAQSTDVVKIRNMTINGLAKSGNAGLSGIKFLAGAALIVEHVGIFGWSVAGVDFEPSVAGAKLFMLDVETQFNTGDGVLVKPQSGGSAGGMLNRVSAMFNTGGGFNAVQSAGSSFFAVVNSAFSGNGYGVEQTTSGGLTGSIMVTGSTITTNNNAGLYSSGATSTIRVGGSTIYRNTTGIQQVSSGVISSFGDNYLAGSSGSDGTPTPPNIPKL